jgi:predicted GNAT family acetyltransferase
MKKIIYIILFFLKSTLIAVIDIQVIKKPLLKETKYIRMYNLKKKLLQKTWNNIRLMVFNDAKENPGYGFDYIKEAYCYRPFKNTDIIYLAKHNDTVVGFLLLSSKNHKQYYISHLQVSSSFQGRGIGALLINAVLENAQAHKKSIISLDCIDSLIPFYKKFNFIVKNVSHDSGMVNMIKKV